MPDGWLLVAQMPPVGTIGVVVDLHPRALAVALLHRDPDAVDGDPGVRAQHVLTQMPILADARRMLAFTVPDARDDGGDLPVAVLVPAQVVVGQRLVRRILGDGGILRPVVAQAGVVLHTALLGLLHVVEDRRADGKVLELRAVCRTTP